MIRALSLLLLVLSAAVSGPAQKPAARVSVLLHGTPLFEGVAADPGILVRLQDFARQVEGVTPARTLVAVRGDAVVLTDAGGCARCPLAAKQPGTIGRLHRRDRDRYVALDDIARALGATVRVVDKSVYSMTCPAGECLGGILGSVQ